MVDHHIDGSVLCTKRFAKLRFREGILTSWGRACAYCGQAAATLDHVRARRRGGATVQRNLVAACETCNRAKGSEEWSAWFRRQVFWAQEREQRIWAWVEGAVALHSDVGEKGGGYRGLWDGAAGEGQGHDGVVMGTGGGLAVA